MINEGELRAKFEGYIALLAPEVRNQGLIFAQKGTVALASGEKLNWNWILTESYLVFASPQLRVRIS